jgi:hypothetical protein
MQPTSVLANHHRDQNGKAVTSPSSSSSSSKSGATNLAAWQHKHRDGMGRDGAPGGGGSVDRSALYLYLSLHTSIYA